MKHNMVCLLTLLLLSLSACRGDGDLPIEDATETWQVMAIVPHSGVGDMGYYDDMYLGLSQMRDSLGCKVYVNNAWYPEDAEAMAKAWLNGEVGRNQHRLLVLGDGAYAEMVERNGWQNTANTTILQLDTDKELPVYTRSLSLYGVCYLAGKYSKDVEQETGRGTAVILANDSDWAVNQGAKGFIEGAGSVGIDADRYLVYDESSRGYDQADSVYHLCYEIASATGFVLPLAGKSNEGVFRYGRDNHINELWTCSESNTYPDHCCFRIWRSVGKLLLDFAVDWKAGTTLEQHKSYGLGSDYVDYTLPQTEEASVKLLYNNEYESEAKKKEGLTK